MVLASEERKTVTDGHSAGVKTLKACSVFLFLFRSF